MTKIAVARIVSTIGHPLVLLAVAGAVALAGSGNAPADGLWLAGAITLGALLIAWTRRQQRIGNWAHVDASQPHERAEWNRTCLGVLALGLVGALFGGAREIALVLAAIALVFVSAMLTARWLHMSQHVAFATLAIFIATSGSLWAVPLFVAVALALTWSRLVLKRHVVKDVVAGGFAGSIAGTMLFWAL